jgi:GNAT superfamily N-acetyltransferase
MPWRTMSSQDLRRVQMLADAIHVSHPEDMDVLAERQGLYPQGCLVLEEAGDVIGYTLAHPWRSHAPPPLNQKLGALPDKPTTFYVHDVALLPQARGKGYAAQGTRILVEHARNMGFGNLSLVAVNRSRTFWETLGFHVTSAPGLDVKLASYGPDAVLMVRDLTKVKA